MASSSMPFSVSNVGLGAGGKGPSPPPLATSFFVDLVQTLPGIINLLWALIVLGRMAPSSSWQFLRSSWTSTAFTTIIISWRRARCSHHRRGVLCRPPSSTTAPASPSDFSDLKSGGEVSRPRICLVLGLLFVHCSYFYVLFISSQYCTPFDQIYSLHLRLRSCLHLAEIS